MLNVGELIKKARIQKGMTQEELAERVGVKKSAVAKWENGRVTEIKRSNMKNLADVLCLNPTQLLGDQYVDESHSKSEIPANIVTRLEYDPQFSEVVKMLHELKPEQLSGFKAMLKSLDL